MDRSTTQPRRSTRVFAFVVACSQLLPSIAVAESLSEILEDVPSQVAASGGLRAVDRDAYFELLDWVRSADLDLLQREAEAWAREREQVHDEATPNYRYSQFADVLANSDAWHGKPIRIIGHANRVVSYSPGPHPLEIANVYESWVVTDSSQRFPIVIVTHDVPDGTPIGEQEVTGVDATGIFFQLFTYRARDGRVRKAPLVIANSWQLPSPPTASSQQRLLVLLAVLFGLSASFSILSILKRSRRARRSYASPQLDFAEPPNDSSLGNFNERDEN